jgi:hypothetical protein
MEKAARGIEQGFQNLLIQKPRRVVMVLLV